MSIMGTRTAKAVTAAFIIIQAMTLPTAQVHGQNVGIGIANPGARLHVIDSNVVFSATGDILFVPGNPPIQGTGRRMMWYADKAAFRTGYVQSSNWNKDSIGPYTFASGWNPKSSGYASISMGGGTVSSGYYSVAMGLNTVALGQGSVALGDSTISFVGTATALGGHTKAFASWSTALGGYTQARGNSSLAAGVATIAKGNGSTVVGLYNDTSDTSDPYSFNSLDRLVQIRHGDR